MLAPAIEYAEEGHPANDGFAAGVRSGQKLLSSAPTSAALFMPAGKLPAAGEIVRNTDFASTLKKMAEAEQSAVTRGATRSAALTAARDRFYKGDIAEEIAGFFKANGGSMVLADLAAYEARWETPLHTTYRGYDVYSNASTSRGGFEVLMQLNLLEGFDLAGVKPGSPLALHLQAEAIKVAKSDIYRYVADPAFTKVPVAGLLSKELRRRAAQTDRSRASCRVPDAGNPAAFASATSVARASATEAALPGLSGPTWPEHYEPDPETTSFSIVDLEVTPLLSHRRSVVEWELVWWSAAPASSSTTAFVLGPRLPTRTT